jgi:hypothetical protein
MNDVLYQCYSLDNRSLLWGINSTNGPVFVNAVKAQTYFDRLYKISHDFDYKRELCPD